MANSKRKCRHCGEYQRADEMVIVPLGAFCSAAHASAYGLKHKAKGAEIKRKTAKKESSKALREFKRKDLKWQEGHTQTSFNRMRVQQEFLWFYSRGVEPYCISCQKTKMDWCCGHNKTRGSNSFLQFDERNTFLQCNRSCNESLSGNINGTPTSIGYLAGLMGRFGIEGQEIIDYCDNSPTVKKRTADEFEELRKKIQCRI